ncbi:unnamed protein product, partial [Rotaria magnacalcarata]
MFPIPGVFAFPELFSNPGLDASGQYSEQAQILNEQIDTQNRVQIILESFLSIMNYCRRLDFFYFLNALLDMMPIIRCIKNYKIRQYLLPDISSGVTVAIMPIPQAKDNIRDDLHHASILIYKMQILSMYHLLWATYWQSGLGQLIKQTPEQQQINYVVYSMNISFWSKEIKQIITTMEEQNIDTYTSPMNLVCYHKQELERQLRQMKIDLNEKVNHVSGYNLKVEQLLQDYITENLHEFRKEIQYEIKIITYDYQIEAIKQEFHRQNPSEYQKKLMEQSCLKRDEKETAEQELKYLQERIDHFNASDQSFEHSAIIDSIENVETRQQLQQQWRKIIEQAKGDFCMLSLKIAEDQRSRAELNYDNQVNKMYSIHDNA